MFGKFPPLCSVVLCLEASKWLIGEQMSQIDMIVNEAIEWENMNETKGVEMHMVTSRSRESVLIW